MKAKGKSTKLAGKGQDGDIIFERAYLFYRKNQNKEALAEIAKGNENEVRFMELKAQLLYRLERGEEALQIFNKLLETHSDEYDETRLANAMAVTALLQSKGMYNHACYLIYQDKLAEATQLLQDAAVKCHETLTEDGLTEEEIQEELAIIEIQKAYALQKAGSTDEAVRIYTEMEKNSSADTNVKAIIMNNLLAAKVVSNTPNVREHLRNISKKKKAKLTHFQKQAILFNLALLQLHPVEKGKAFEEFVTGKLNKRKRKRKTKLPKNYDPNVAPDPERWLPRQERTAYKKKLNKKFKDRDIGRGTQGAGSSQTAAANIDYSSKASSVEPQPSPNPLLVAALKVLDNSVRRSSTG
uniref:Signal recognition particle subunit SRP72 n=1 Tax=Ditylenchus dipsaci TaxID=166011 RepID=A0A915DFZ4_9BILA